VVDLRGDIDLDSSPRVKEAIQAAAEPGSSVALNMGGVGYLDSSGLGILLGARKRLHPRSLHLFGFNEQIGRIIALTGLDKLFDVHANEADALAHARSEIAADAPATPNEIAIPVNATPGAVAATATPARDSDIAAALAARHMPRDSPLEAAGRVVIVTGAGGGVGRTVSLRWLDAGAQVLAIDRADGHGLGDLRAAWAERVAAPPRRSPDWRPWALTSQPRRAPWRWQPRPRGFLVGRPTPWCISSAALPWEGLRRRMRRTHGGGSLR
jgi:anti-sigma B factor antagonist